MRRTTTETRIGEGRVRYRTRIEDDDCADGPAAYRQQYWFLRTLSENWALTQCGFSSFQKMNIFFDGNHWVAECEAVVDETAT